MSKPMNLRTKSLCKGKNQMNQDRKKRKKPTRLMNQLRALMGVPHTRLPHSQQQSKYEPTKPDKKRKKIIVISDSILNGLDELGLQRSHNVCVRAHPGATSQGIFDHIKHSARKQPDCIIIHAGSNNLTNGVDTKQNLKLAIEEAKKESSNTDFALSAIE